MPFDWYFPEKPQPYGYFHIIWLIIAAIGVIIALNISKKHNKKRDDIVVFSICSFLLLTEIYKQIFLYKGSGDRYNWGSFPFQLCSIPMYLGTIGPFIRNEKVKNTIYKYLAYTGTIGGLAIMLIPNVCLSKLAFLSMHSMLWHSVLVFLGFYLIRSRDLGKTIFKGTLAPGMILFVVMSIALILNFALYPIAQKNGHGFNMISLSYYQKNDPAILDVIFNIVPYPIYALIVFLGIYSAMPAINSVAYLIRYISSKFKKRLN